MALYRCGGEKVFNAADYNLKHVETVQALGTKTCTYNVEIGDIFTFGWYDCTISGGFYHEDTEHIKGRQVAYQATSNTITFKYTNSASNGTGNIWRIVKNS